MSEETAGEYLDRIESDHDVLHLANQKIAQLEAENAWMRDVERLASVFHDAWCHWAKAVGELEPISERRLKRWAGYFVPYKDLPEEAKKMDRAWARKALQGGE